MKKGSFFNICMLILTCLFLSCSKDDGPDVIEDIQILSVSPISGTIGEYVVIEGLGFGDFLEDNTVEFNGKTAIIFTASTTRLVVVVPIGASTGPITLKVHDRRVKSAMDFEVVTAVGKSLSSVSN